MTIVPDVSFWQDDNNTPQGVSFETMKAAGASGVIIRAGQNSWVDSDFKTNWAAAKTAGLPRGSYWFYDSRVEPAKQANLWHAAMAGDYPELGVWADFEENYGGPFGEEKHFKQFVLAVGVYFPKILLGVYTSWGWWDKAGRIADNAFWKSFPLWVAQYNPTLERLPKSWSEWVFWQFTASGDGFTYGVESAEIDLNRFNGDENKFRLLFNLGEQPQEGQVMYRYNATSIYRMSLRPAHDTNNTPLTSIPAQSKMQGNELWVDGVEKWLKVEAVNGVTLPVFGWVAIEHDGRVYCALTDNNPPVGDPDCVVAYWADGRSQKYIPE